METRANFVLLGVAVLIGAAAIMLFSAWLVGSDWREGRRLYDVVFAGPVRGLSEGGEVQFNGIRVGEVESLRIDELNPTRIVARIRIRAATPLRSDTSAQLEAVGLTGVTLVQLTPGLASAPPLAARLGAPPPRIQARQGLIDELLTPQNAQNFTETLRNMRTISRELAGEDSVVAESGQAAREIAAAARSVAGAAEDLRTQFSGLRARGDHALTSAGVVAERGERAFAEIETAARTVDEVSPRFVRAADQLSDAASTVDEVLHGGRSYAPPVIEVAP